MNRRTAIKTLGVASGGLITLPLWMASCGLSDKKTHQSGFSEEERDLLAKVTDIIIPAGNAVGALSVGVDKFLQQLFDDCYEKPVQDNIKKQLNALNTESKKLFNKPFTSCTQQQGETLLSKLSASSIKEEKDFYSLVKSETIRGFTTSQKVMVDYLGYKIAPGHYYGSVNIKS
jgi:hypothetical protein